MSDRLLTQNTQTMFLFQIITIKCISVLWWSFFWNPNLIWIVKTKCSYKAISEGRIKYRPELGDTESCVDGSLLWLANASKFPLVIDLNKTLSAILMLTIIPSVESKKGAITTDFVHKNTLLALNWRYHCCVSQGCDSVCEKSEMIWNDLKCLKRCAFQWIKSLKMGFCEEQIRLKSDKNLNSHIPGITEVFTEVCKIRS